MEKGENFISNPILLILVLDNSSSQELLSHRLVCKFWRNEANRLIRQRQHKFFFSPATKTKATAVYTDHQWKKSWTNVLQIPFIYSPRRDTFIRASRRLLYSAHASLHLEAAPEKGHENFMEEFQLQSACDQEVEDYHHGQMPTTAMRLISKMAGSTLDQFTDFLESTILGQLEGSTQNQNFEDQKFGDHSILPHLSFRFECGRLWSRPEICRFFGVMGRNIRYLTVNIHHMCTPGQGGNHDDPRWWRDSEWDPDYTVFRQVPNLSVLTLIQATRWYNKHGGLSVYRIPNLPPDSPQKSEIVTGGGDVGQEEKGPLGRLKILRLQGGPNAHPKIGNYVRWIMFKARRVEKIVFEMGFSPSFLTLLQEKNLECDLDLKAPLNLGVSPPSPLRLYPPITSLCLDLSISDCPQLFEYTGQVIKIQGVGRTCPSRVKTLRLYLHEPIIVPGGREISPYNAPLVPPLLGILKTVSESVETMSLAGAAGVFLQGLIQVQKNIEVNEVNDINDPRPLLSFPSVHTLHLALHSLRTLSRPEFDLNPDQKSNSSTLTSTSTSTVTSTSSSSWTTTLANVFPRVQEIEFHYLPEYGVDSDLWWSFGPRPYIMVQNQGQGRGLKDQGQVIEVKSVRKLSFGIVLDLGGWFPLKTGEIWQFSNLETISLWFRQFCIVASNLWSECTKVRTLVIHTVASVVDHRKVNEKSVSATGMEALFTGLDEDVLAIELESIESLELAGTAREKRERLLQEKRAAFKALVTTDTSRPSIFNLGQLQTLKLLLRVWMGPGETFEPLFSSIMGLLIFDLLPSSCQITMWGASNAQIEDGPPLSQQNLERAVGHSVATHPRVTLKTFRSEILGPPLPC